MKVIDKLASLASSSVLVTTLLFLQIAAAERPSKLRQFQPLPSQLADPEFSGNGPHNIDLQDPLKHPSVAVVEFDPKGEPWTRCTLPVAPTKWTCQPQFVIDFIHNARTKTPAGSNLTVLTFVHGWTHNAQISDWNFIHLREGVDCLNWGSEAYKAAYRDFILLSADQDGQKHLSCDGIPAQTERRFVAVYVGWQGTTRDLNRGNFTLKPVYKAAFQTLRSDVFVSYIQGIGNAAKDDLVPYPTARAILIGHSMGGMIVESLAYNYLTQVGGILSPSCSELGYEAARRPFDLYFLVNPFHNASVGVKTVLAMQKVRPCTTPEIAQALPSPLVISIHSLTDKYTGAALAEANAVWFHIPGISFFAPKFPPVTTPPIPNSEAYIDRAPTNGALNRWSFNHAVYLLNLCFVNSSEVNDRSRTGDYTCDRVAAFNQKREQDAGFSVANDQPEGAYEMLASICDETKPNSCPSTEEGELKHKRNQLNEALRDTLAFPSASSSGQPNILLNLYVRFDPGCNHQGNHPELPPCQIYGGEEIFRDGRDGQKFLVPWNSTAFWAFNVPDNIVSGHSNFWTDGFSSLVLGIVDNVLKPRAPGRNP